MNEIEKLIEYQKSMNSPDHDVGGKHYWDLTRKDTKRMKVFNWIALILLVVGLGSWILMVFDVI